MPFSKGHSEDEYPKFSEAAMLKLGINLMYKVLQLNVLLDHEQVETIQTTLNFCLEAKCQDYQIIFHEVSFIVFEIFKLP